MNPTFLLLVDDNPTFLRILQDFLKKHSDLAIAGTAEDGAEAMKLAEELRPDIILLDMALPDMSGLDVIAQLREKLPEVDIIALTGLGMEGYRKMALHLGAAEFVTKADMSTDLLPAIRRVAQQRG